jgi:hypothetical protein
LKEAEHPDERVEHEEGDGDDQEVLDSLDKQSFPSVIADCDLRDGEFFFHHLSPNIRPSNGNF